MKLKRSVEIESSRLIREVSGDGTKRMVEDGRCDVGTPIIGVNLPDVDGDDILGMFVDGDVGLDNDAVVGVSDLGKSVHDILEDVVNVAAIELGGIAWREDTDVETDGGIDERGFELLIDEGAELLLPVAGLRISVDQAAACSAGALRGRRSNGYDDSIDAHDDGLLSKCVNKATQLLE